MARTIRRGWAVLLLGGVGGCGGGGSDGWADRPGPKVVAFFPPLYSLAAAVAGEDAQVHCLLSTTGPHEYEPSAHDARRLRRADLFVLNGLGLDDPFAAKLRQTAGRPALKLLKLGDCVPEGDLLESRSDHGEHAHAGHHDADPHAWLGVAEAARLVPALRDALTELDAAHAADYAGRAAALTDRLTKLQDEGKRLLAAKSEKARLLTFHDSLRYWARGFGAEIADSIEAPGVEAGGRRVRELVKLCREKQVRLIAVEPQYPQNTAAKTLLDELKRQGIDAAFVEIDPMETALAGDLTADYYERKTRRNLDALLKVLK